MTLLRSIVFQIYFALISAVICIVWIPTFLAPASWVQFGMRVWARTTLFGLRVICGLTYEVRGREHLPKKPALVAGKHQAMWDTVILPLLIHDPGFVMKRQLLAVPLYGWYSLKMRMITLDRSAHASALRSLVAQAKKCLAENRSIVIFPEGTRKKPGAPTDYKPGVAALYTQLGIDCVPFALNSGLYWKGFKRLPGKIVIEILPPIPAGLRRQEFMARLQETVETRTAALVAEARGA